MKNAGIFFFFQMLRLKPSSGCLQFDVGGGGRGNTIQVPAPSLGSTQLQTTPFLIPWTTHTHSDRHTDTRNTRFIHADFLLGPGVHCLCGRNNIKSLGMGTALCGRDQQTFYKGSGSEYFGLCGPLGLRGNHSVLEGLSAAIAVRESSHIRNK